MNDALGGMLQFALIVPTFNPGARWAEWLEALHRQSVTPSRVLIVDSESDDGHLSIPDDPRFECHHIAHATFNHGGTRQQAFERIAEKVDVVVMMTQDAVLADDRSLETLLASFDDDSVAAAYGRQLPHANADPFAAHARLYNYGFSSEIRRLADRTRLGIKTCFLSNSFAAYRCQELKSVGGFPITQFGEDMWVAARLLLNQRNIAYVAEARVYHSHDYTVREEFLRYHTTGRFHAQYPWLLSEFGGTNGEGRRFVLSEVAYLIRHAPHLLPAAALRTLVKFSAYQMGYRQKPSTEGGRPNRTGH